MDGMPDFRGCGALSSPRRRRRHMTCPTLADRRIDCDLGCAMHARTTGEAARFSRQSMCDRSILDAPLATVFLLIYKVIIKG